LPLCKRSALWEPRSSPYSTALYLLQQHAADKDFTDAVSLIEHAKALLRRPPPALIGPLFDNLLVSCAVQERSAIRPEGVRRRHSDPHQPGTLSQRRRSTTYS